MRLLSQCLVAFLFSDGRNELYLVDQTRKAFQLILTLLAVSWYLIQGQEDTSVVLVLSLDIQLHVWHRYNQLFSVTGLGV